MHCRNLSPKRLSIHIVHTIKKVNQPTTFHTGGSKFFLVRSNDLTDNETLLSLSTPTPIIPVYRYSFHELDCSLSLSQAELSGDLKVERQLKKREGRNEIGHHEKGRRRRIARKKIKYRYSNFYTYGFGY